MDSRASLFLRWSGIATCCLASLPVWVTLFRDPSLPASAWLAGFLLFLAAFFWNTADSSRERPVSARRAALLVQSLSALGLGLLLRNSLNAVLLVIVAAQLPACLTFPVALVWVAVQTAALLAILVQDFGVVMGITLTGAFGGFQLFALYTFHIAESERRARDELARAHESLLATRQLLAESTRAAERLRIARELHDVLGHHLTALTLNLEAALHSPEVPRERVAAAQRLARGMLQEVRQVVSVLRQEPEGEPAAPAPGFPGPEAGPEAPLEQRLAIAIAALSSGVEEPLVHLTVRPGAEVQDPDRAHVLLRCAQEVFTNTVRHAGARNLWLEVDRSGPGVEIRARDDGRGAAEVVPGNGLQGMRERVERLGGRLAVSSRPGQGFEVTAWIPA